MGCLYKLGNKVHTKETVIHLYGNIIGAKANYSWLRVMAEWDSTEIRPERRVRRGFTCLYLYKWKKNSNVGLVNMWLVLNYMGLLINTAEKVNSELLWPYFFNGQKWRNLIGTNIKGSTYRKKEKPRIQMQHRKGLVRSWYNRKELGVIFDNELNKINHRLSLKDKPI